MSVLTKDEILEQITKEKISFFPNLDSFQIQPHSIDLRLGFEFMVPKTWEMTKKGRVVLNIDYLGGVDKNNFETIELKAGQYFEILPREFVVVNTLEKVSFPADIMAVLYPRSSVNRRGLSVDLSGIIDAGYEGRLIIPVKNNTSSQVIRLYPGERFCQLVFHRFDRAVDIKKSRFAKKKRCLGIFKEEDKKEAVLIKEGRIADLKNKFSFNVNEL